MSTTKTSPKATTTEGAVKGDDGRHRGRDRNGIIGTRADGKALGGHYDPGFEPKKA